MEKHYEEYWRSFGESRRLRRAIAISLAIHIVVALLMTQILPRKREFIVPSAFEVALMNQPSVNDNPPPPTPEPPTPEPPQPEPPKPEPPKPPDPEPPKVVEAKPPEPEKEKKEETKPKEKPKPKEKAKEKQKEEPKPKETAKPKPTPKAQQQPQKPPQQQKEKPTETGVAVQAGVPSELAAWARLVEKKILKNWMIPAGILLDPNNNQADVAFWVDRQGNLIGQPEIIKEASDPEVGQSGIQAILLSVPLPPFPPECSKQEQEVVYTFTVVQ